MVSLGKWFTAFQGSKVTLIYSPSLTVFSCEMKCLLSDTWWQVDLTGFINDFVSLRETRLGKVVMS